MNDQHHQADEPRAGQPMSPQKQSFSIKRVMGLLTGSLSVIASAAAVYGLVQGYFDPDPTLDDIAKQQQQLQQTIQAQKEDGDLVNQVSRRVTEFSDQFNRIQNNLADVRQLDEALAKKSPKGKILTLSQKKLLEASIQKEREELLRLIDEAKRAATSFIQAMEKDSTLEKITTTDSQAGRTKARALRHLDDIKTKILPELEKLEQEHRQ